MSSSIWQVGIQWVQIRRHLIFPKNKWINSNKEELLKSTSSLILWPSKLWCTCLEDTYHGIKNLRNFISNPIKKLELLQLKFRQQETNNLSFIWTNIHASDYAFIRIERLFSFPDIFRYWYFNINSKQINQFFLSFEVILATIFILSELSWLLKSEKYWCKMKFSKKKTILK